MLCRVEKKNTLCHAVEKKHTAKNGLDDLVSLPASWLWVVKTLGRMRLLRVLVLAHERVGILLLIEVAEGVVNFSMLALVRTDYSSLIPG